VRCGVYRVTSLLNFLILPIVQQHRLIISPPVNTWWLRHLLSQTTLILHFVLIVYFRVPCNYHNNPLFLFTTFTGHFSNGRTDVFSSRCEQTVCSTQAKGCTVTEGRWRSSSIHSLAARRGPVVIATPRPLFPRKKKTQYSLGKSGWMRKPPQGFKLCTTEPVQSRYTNAPSWQPDLYIERRLISVLKWDHVRGQRSSG
jgi:hypothetical protein